MKKLLFLLLCTALVASSFMSCSDKEKNNLTESESVANEDNAGETISTNDAEESNQLDDTVLIPLLENTLYKNGLKIVNWICSGAGLDLDYDIVFETDNPSIEYVSVENIRDMQAFKEICEEIFSKEFLSANVYPDLIEGDYPLFTENESRLYYNKNTGGAYPFAPDFTRANVMKNEADAFEIEVPMTEVSDQEGKLFTFKAVRQNGNWVLDNFYFYFQNNSSETKNFEDEINSSEIWTSDEFLMKFENFQEDLAQRLTFDLGLEYQHDDGRAEEHIENYLKRAGTPAAIYLVWKAYQLEAALGTEFEEVENNYTGYDYIIPKDTVMNVIEQYGIDESKLDWRDFRDYDENSDYFIVPDGFSGMYFDREILYDTLVYSPATNIVTLDITFYQMDTERQFELCTFRYKFEPFLYKDNIWCYKFIGTELISRG